jgi:hypothetical protein
MVMTFKEHEHPVRKLHQLEGAAKIVRAGEGAGLTIRVNRGIARLQSALIAFPALAARPIERLRPRQHLRLLAGKARRRNAPERFRRGVPKGSSPG